MPKGTRKTVTKKSLLGRCCPIDEQSDLQRAIYLATNTTLTMNASQRTIAKEQFEMLDGTGGSLDESTEATLVFTFANWLNNCKG